MTLAEFLDQNGLCERLEIEIRSASYAGVNVNDIPEDEQKRLLRQAHEEFSSWVRNRVKEGSDYFYVSRGTEDEGRGVVLGVDFAGKDRVSAWNSMIDSIEALEARENLPCNFRRPLLRI